MNDKDGNFSGMVGAYGGGKGDNAPMFGFIHPDAEHAAYCKVCGELPEISIANFKDKVKYRDNVYISCPHCGHCDGEWYPDVKTALAKWNEDNEGSKPRDRSVKDLDDFVDEMMADFHMKE